MDTKITTGEDFRTLIKTSNLTETEVGNLLGCTRENVFKLYKKLKVKNAYVAVIKNYIQQTLNLTSNRRKISSNIDFNNSKQSGNIAVTTHENEKFANSIEGYIKAINILNKKIDKLESEKDLLLDTNAKLTNHIEWLTTLTAKKNTKPH